MKMCFLRPRSASEAYLGLILILTACSGQAPHLDSISQESADPVRAAFDRAERLRKAGAPEDLNEALGLYKEVLDSWGDVDNEDATRCRLGIGLILLKLGDRAALETFGEALETLGPPEEAEFRAELLNLLGRAYTARSEPDKAIQCHEQAASVSESFGDDFRLAESLVHLALPKRSAGDVGESIQLLERAILIWRELKEGGRLAHALWEAGRSYSLVDLMEEASDRHQEALSIYREAGNKPSQAGVLLEIGWLYHLREETEKAIDIVAQSVALFKASGGVPAGAFDRLGSVFRNAGRFEESLGFYRKALAQKGPKPTVNRAANLANLSELYIKWGQPKTARAYGEQALSVLESHRDISLQAHTLYLLSLAERDLGHLRKSEDHLSRALELADSVRYRLPLPTYRQSYQSAYSPYYEAYVDLLMRQQREDPGAGFDRRALEAAERIRARSLEEALANPAGLADTDGAAEQRIRQLDKQLEALDEQRAQLIEDGAPAHEMAALEKEQQRILLESERLESEAAGSQVESISAGGIQELLGGDTLLLYYFVGKKNAFLWRIDSRSVRSYSLGSAADLEELARRLNALFNQRQNPAVQLQVQLHLQRLSADLLGPVANGLDSKRLVIVPDSAIQYIPFAALTDGDGELLLSRSSLTYLPSASAWRAIQLRERSRLEAPKRLAVFADPVFSRDDPRLAAASTVAGTQAPALAGLTRAAVELGVMEEGGRWPRLPETRREGEAILGTVPSGSGFGAFDFAASRGTFLAVDMSQFQVIHFATHALLHPRYPDLSGIVLSLIDENGQWQPGFLRSNDIARLSLRADLAVLSACRTAIGRQVAGEGVIGLPQAFIEAGVPRTVVSLWRVSDAATAELMSRFYQAMDDQTRRPAEALRLAQLSMLQEENWRDPFHWAGFVVVGGPDEP